MLPPSSGWGVEVFWDVTLFMLWYPRKVLFRIRTKCLLNTKDCFLGYLTTLLQLTKLHCDEREWKIILNGDGVRIWKEDVACFMALSEYSPEDSR
jgi:hypothetical protein